MVELKTDCTGFLLTKVCTPVRRSEIPAPVFGFLSNLDSPHHIKLHFSHSEPRSSLSRWDPDWFHLSNSSPVRTWPAPDCTSVDVSSVSLDHFCFLWWLWQPRLLKLRWVYPCLTMDHDAWVGPGWNTAILPLSWKVTHPFVQGQWDNQKSLVCQQLWLYIWDTGVHVCHKLSVWWCPGHSVGPRIHTLCTQLSLCQKNVPQTPHERCLLRYYHAFHQTRFISHGLWNMCGEIHGSHSGSKVREVIVAYLDLWAVSESCCLSSNNCLWKYFLENFLDNCLVSVIYLQNDHFLVKLNMSLVP